MEITAFGRTLHIGFADGHKTRQTATTIVTIPNTVPKDSLRQPDEYTLRRFAYSPIPRRAISLIRDAVLAQNWRIVPVKPNDKRSYKFAINAITNVITKPNETDTYQSFWGQVLSETLVGDNGAAEIVFTGNSNQPMKLYPVNGFALEKVKGFYTDPNYYRFLQRIDGMNKVYLYDKDIIYLQHYQTVDSPFGMSPLLSAYNQINALLNAEEYAASQASNAFPKNALSLGEGADETSIHALRKYIREEVQGSGDMAVFGGTKGASSLKIGTDGDEGIFLQWQSHLITIIALAFSIDPKKLGQGSNTDRSTVEEQNESMMNEAIRPYCLLLADQINKKIIDRLGFGDELKFEFVFDDTLDQKKKRQSLIVEQWNTNGVTLAEYRTALGLPPISSEYNDMTQAEMKSALNKKYAVQTGGFNGLGKNRKEDIEQKES